jgi:hypothetical protein
LQIAVLIGGREEAKQEEEASRKKQTKQRRRRVGRPARPLCKPRGREQSVLVRGQQLIQAAIIRGGSLPAGHVVAEPWPSQTYRPRKLTGKENSKGKKREEQRRYRQRRRARGDEGDQQRARQS